MSDNHLQLVKPICSVCDDEGRVRSQEVITVNGSTYFSAERIEPCPRCCRPIRQPHTPS